MLKAATICFLAFDVIHVCLAARSDDAHTLRRLGKHDAGASRDVITLKRKPR